MAAKLIAEEGMLKGLVLPLEEGEQWVIGRDPDACQLLVEDPTASRQHMICRHTIQGITVENLSTTNPVQVNEEEIPEPRLLRHGDAVRIGSGLFRFYTDTEAHVDDMPKQNNNNHRPSEHDENEQVSEEEKSKQDAAGGMTTSTMKETDEASPDAREPEEKPAQVAHGAVDIDNELEEHDSIFDLAQMDQDDDALAQIDFGLMDTGRWFIKVIGGPHTGAEFAMQPGTSYVIGTDPATCDIVFHDVSVSRQHARLTAGKDETVTIEDLKSRNGTFIDDQAITGPKNIPSNTVVTMGTTSFVVLDREGKRDTIISPLLPSIVKVLQREEEKKASDAAAAATAAAAVEKSTEKPAEAASTAAAQPAKGHENVASHYGALIMIAMITGILVIVGISTTTLFKTQEVVMPQVNIKEKLDEALAPYPGVKYSFNKNTGRLLIVGHVLNAVDRTQLLYNLQGLTFIKTIDPNIIIDEYVWQEINQVISKSPEWRGIAVHSPSPGRFVITGYLKSRKQSDLLNDYLSQNFPYIDLLEKNIVVEEDMLTQINVNLQESGFRDVAVQMSNGEVSLSGTMSFERSTELEKVIEQIKKIPGVRNVNNFVVELAPEQSIINITSKYKVTGSSNQGDMNVSVVINGRILSRGDVLDGMTITSIKPTAIFLERDGIKYRIDYNK